MDLALPEFLMIVLSLAIPLGFILLIYILINNWVKKSNALKNENNRLLREMIELLKKNQKI